MTLYVAAGLAAGPFIGSFVARHPLRRSTMVLLISGATAAAWAAVLLTPGRSPLWLLAILVVVLAIGGPGSMIGFDFARTFNPAHRIGTATGIVNVGGFIAALVAIFLIGFVLDILLASGYSGGELYGLEPFRIALSVHFLLLGFGAVMMLRYPAKSAAPDGGAGCGGGPAAAGHGTAAARQPGPAPPTGQRGIGPALVLHIGLPGAVVDIAELGASTLGVPAQSWSHETSRTPDRPRP